MALGVAPILEVDPMLTTPNIYGILVIIFLLLLIVYLWRRVK